MKLNNIKIVLTVDDKEYPETIIAVDHEITKEVSEEISNIMKTWFIGMFNSLVEVNKHD